jgi:hypothetical protein
LFLSKINKEKKVMNKTKINNKIAYELRINKFSELCLCIEEKIFWSKYAMN